MKISKIITATVLSLAMFTSTVAVPANITNSASVIDPIAKLSVDYNDMTYLIEKHGDSSIIVKAYFIGDPKKIYYDYDVIGITVPVGNMYNISASEIQGYANADIDCAFTFDYTERVEKWNGIGDIYMYHASNYECGFHFNKGLVAIFTITPTSEYCSDIKIWEETISPDFFADDSRINYQLELTTLKEENTNLKNQIAELQAGTGDNNDSIQKFDINNDGMLDAVDATTILQIYAINSTGGNIQTMTDFYNYIQEQETPVGE